MADQDEPASIDLRKARELAAAIRDNADYECCDDETRRLARAVLHLTAELARVEAERDAARRAVDELRRHIDGYDSVFDYVYGKAGAVADPDWYWPTPTAAKESDRG